MYSTTIVQRWLETKEFKPSKLPLNDQEVVVRAITSKKRASDCLLTELQARESMTSLLLSKSIASV